MVFRHIILVIIDGHEGVQLFGRSNLHHYQPSIVVRVVIYKCRRIEHLLVNLQDRPTDRSIELRHRLSCFHGAERVILLQIVTQLGKFQGRDGPQFMLGIVGYSDYPALPSTLTQMCSLLYFKFFRKIHGYPNTVLSRKLVSIFPSMKSLLAMIALVERNRGLYSFDDVLIQRPGHPLYGVIPRFGMDYQFGDE